VYGLATVALPVTDDIRKRSFQLIWTISQCCTSRNDAISRR